MVALSKLTMQDLSRQKRLEVELSPAGELTPSHTVGQAIDHFKHRLQSGDSMSRFAAFSRGRTLDHKRHLGELEPEDALWTVIPEVSAG